MNLNSVRGLGSALMLSFMSLALSGCGGGDGGGHHNSSSSGGSSSSSSSSGASSSSGSSSSSSSGTSATLTAVQVTPANPSIALGTTQQFTATAIYSDSSKQDVTAQASWSAVDPTVASISASGLAKALKQGSTGIGATYQGLSGSATLAVTPAVISSLAVTPGSASIAKGTTRQFTATATLSDGTTQNETANVTWSSTATAVATIDANGLATGVATGSATIKAVHKTAAVSATASLTVTPAVVASVAVTPANASLAKGTTRQYAATATFTDSTTQDVTKTVTWSSSATGVATVSNAGGSNGLVAAVAPGSATISAAYPNGPTGSTGLTVTTAALVSIQVTPSNSSLPKGFKRQFSATGIYSDSSKQDITAQAVWSTSDSATATVSNAAADSGDVTGVAAGNVTVTAALNGVSGFTALKVTGASLRSIQVNPANATLAGGLSQDYTATGVFSDSSTLDLTTQVTWASDNSAVASISNDAGSQGHVQTSVPASPPATVHISATSGATTGSTRLTVTAASITKISIAACVDSACKSTTTAAVNLPKGEKQRYHALADFTDGSTGVDVTGSVTWASSNTGAATIDANGIAQGVNQGTAGITASSGAVTSNSLTLNVTAAQLLQITISTPNTTVPDGLQPQFTATGFYSDGSSRDITTEATWASSATNVATISNASGSNGLVTTVGAGSTNISADDSGVASNIVALTVTNAQLVSIAVTPADATIPLQTTLQFHATGTYTDNSTQDLTTSVTWSVSDTSVAQVDNSPGDQGVVSGTAQGTDTLTATDSASGKTGSVSFTVGGPKLVSIQVTAANSGHVPAGYVLQFHATGTYSDSSTKDLTGSATWSTFDPSVATVSNSAGIAGLVTGVKSGSTTVLASFGSVSGFSAVTVGNATLTGLAITPANPTIGNVGGTIQFTATGSFNDGESLDLTDMATWASSNSSVATISNSAGSQGLATVKSALVGGTSTISATLNGANASTTLTRKLGG